jgi:hypothetical protein
MNNEILIIQGFFHLQATETDSSQLKHRGIYWKLLLTLCVNLSGPPGAKILCNDI